MIINNNPGKEEEATSKNNLLWKKGSQLLFLPVDPLWAGLFQPSQTSLWELQNASCL